MNEAPGASAAGETRRVQRKYDRLAPGYDRVMSVDELHRSVLGIVLRLAARKPE